MSYCLRSLVISGGEARRTASMGRGVELIRKLSCRQGHVYRARSRQKATYHYHKNCDSMRPQAIFERRPYASTRDYNPSFCQARIQSRDSRPAPSTLLMSCVHTNDYGSITRTTRKCPVVWGTKRNGSAHSCRRPLVYVYPPFSRGHHPCLPLYPEAA